MENLKWTTMLANYLKSLIIKPKALHANVLELQSSFCSAKNPCSSAANLSTADPDREVLEYSPDKVSAFAAVIGELTDKIKALRTFCFRMFIVVIVPFWSALLASDCDSLLNTPLYNYVGSDCSRGLFFLFVYVGPVFLMAVLLDTIITLSRVRIVLFCFYLFGLIFFLFTAWFMSSDVMLKAISILGVMFFAVYLMECWVSKRKAFLHSDLYAKTFPSLEIYCQQALRREHFVCFGREVINPVAEMRDLYNEMCWDYCAMKTVTFLGMLCMAVPFLILAIALLVR